MIIVTCAHVHGGSAGKNFDARFFQKLVDLILSYQTVPSRWPMRRMVSVLERFKVVRNFVKLPKMVNPTCAHVHGGSAEDIFGATFFDEMKVRNIAYRIEFVALL